MIVQTSIFPASVAGAREQDNTDRALMNKQEA